MVQLGALHVLQGSTKTSINTVLLAPSDQYTVSKPACSLSTSVRPIIPKVSCKYSPSMASDNVIDRHLVCAQSHEPLRKQNELVKQDLVNPCQRPLFSENWIEDCISEIVKHIHEAPFLQMLVSRKDSSAVTMTQRQRVPVGGALSADDKWRTMRSHVSEASPDAVILVHDLCDSYIEDYKVEEGLAKQSRGLCYGKEGRSNGRHLWGLLVLGKTIADSACYILETTSVASSFGTCTCFCLTKAQSFGPSWTDQIQSSWLFNTEV